jgi:hypothetical protein
MKLEVISDEDRDEEKSRGCLRVDRIKEFICLLLSDKVRVK